MANETTTVSSGFGFSSLLAVLFIGLKLTGYIAWSWWWVLSPLWFGPAFIIAILLLIAITAFLVALGK